LYLLTQGDIDKLEETLKRLDRTILDQTAKIKEEKNRSDDDAKRREQESELERLRENVSELTITIAEAEENKRAQEQAIKGKESESKRAADKRDYIMSQITDLKGKITEMERSKTSRLLPFHQKMPEAMRQIQARRSQFKQMPIGPLGMHVKILKEEWADICEQLFGAKLNGFLVSSHEDQITLAKILRDVGWYPIRCTR
jgi:structural maintenance of chromosomes protein 6